jgi:spore germination cell wall hydrolase CwlJ-like protein
MFGIVRAAGYAAAAVGAALSPGFADPSQAWELDTSVQTPGYTSHVTASIESGPPEASAAEVSESPFSSLDTSAPVAEHAVATLSAEPMPDAPVRSLGALVEVYADTDVADREMECLAGAIYFESKGEPLAGQLAVANVIINRTKSGRYPTTLCGVVKQPSQFSFVRGGRMPGIARDSAHWRKAVAIAHIARNELAASPVPRALAFHATRVSPGWRMKRLATVGRHVFYR